MSRGSIEVTKNVGRQEAEESSQLRELSTRILDNIPSGLVTLSPGNKVIRANAVFLSWNPNVRAGTDAHEAFPAASAQVRATIRRLVEQAAALRRPAFEHLERATLFPASAGAYALRVVPLETPLADVGALLIVEDLSRLRRLEQELIHSLKLSAIGTVTTGLAHEIGTPLGVIRVRAEHLLEKAGDEPGRRSLQAIVEQCDAISRIVHQVLDFARHREVDPQRVDVADACQSALDSLRPAFERAGVVVEMAIDPTLPAVRAEPDGLRRVLVNILINAKDACTRGGRVRVVGRLEGPPSKELVVIEIADDGSGIPERDLLRIFDPFYTTKKRGEGTGLGLAIARDIVGNHGGTLTAENLRGSGAVFSVRWPAAPHGPEREDG